MTWSAPTSLLSAETAALAADMPLLITNNIVDACLPGARALMNITGQFTGADASLSTSPTYRAVDRSGLQRAIAGSAQTVWYLVLNAVAGVPYKTEVFDAVYIANHNLTGVTNLTIEFQRSSTSDFASVTTMFTLTTLNADRHLHLFSERVSGTGYVRLRLSMSSGTFTPEIGEFWVGRRRQLRTHARLPVDYERTRSSGNYDGRISRDGNIEYTSRGEFDISFRLRDTDSTLQDSETIASWWAECEGGRFPSILVTHPNSAPHRARIVRPTSPSLVISRENFGERVVSLSFREQPPFLGLSV